MHALRECAVRGGVPGGGDDALGRGLEPDDVQPVRGDPVLLEQLSVQGEAVQFLQLWTECDAGLGEVEEESGGDGADGGGKGEVHLLRAAAAADADRDRGGGGGDCGAGGGGGFGGGT